MMHGQPHIKLNIVSGTTCDLDVSVRKKFGNLSVIIFTGFIFQHTFSLFLMSVCTPVFQTLHQFVKKFLDVNNFH